MKNLKQDKKRSTVLKIWNQFEDASGRGLEGTEMSPREEWKLELEEVEPESQVDRELACLLLLAYLLSLLTGWLWFSADSQQVLLFLLVWISALALLLSVVITQLRLQMGTRPTS